MNPLAVFNNGVDWLMGHLEGAQLVTFSDESDDTHFFATITVERYGRSTHVEFELIVRSCSYVWAIDFREFDSANTLALYICQQYLINLVFTGSLVEQIAAELSPYASHPFRHRCRHPDTGMNVTRLLFHPDAISPLVESFDAAQLRAAIDHYSTAVYRPQNITLALADRLDRLERAHLYANKGVTQ